MSPEEYLFRYFGYASFRSQQKEVINSILSKQDTLAILPTGTGKSICFQIPGLIFEGMTVVVSPLIALMKDQVDQLQKISISAAYIASDLNNEEQKIIYKKLKNNEIKFLYLSPERLTQKKCLEILKNIKIDLVVIDEAHCISQWGDCFRPSYNEIHHFISLCKYRPVIAIFTATANDQAIEVIVSSLKLMKIQKYISNELRTNLCINYYYCETLFHQTLFFTKIINKHKNDLGIIYAATRADVEYLYHLCLDWKLVDEKKLGFYHGGLSSSDRSSTQEKFIKGQYNLLIATNAFGMGINTPNIRFILHYQISASLFHYYQEIGRAGRDQQLSQTYVLFNPNNIEIQKNFIESLKDDSVKKKQFRELQLMIHFCLYKGCKQSFISHYFCNTPNTLSCKTMCSNCHKENNSLINNSFVKQFEKIILIRNKLAKKYKIIPNEIYNLKTACYLAELKPENRKSLSKVPGIGTGWLDTWYGDFKMEYYSQK